MSTATLERATPVIEWAEWTIGNNGIGERRYFVLRHELETTAAAAGRHPATQWHVNAKGDAIKYTQAGAEKKARELNQLAADDRRRDAYLAKREAERQAQQDMAKEVREIAQCGTTNSEMIARWIIGNFTYNDEVQDLREELGMAKASAKYDREAAEETEERLAKVRERCDSLATEARVLMAELGAFGPPVFRDPLEFAAGSTPLEKVVDMSRNLVAALEAYEEAS